METKIEIRLHFLFPEEMYVNLAWQVSWLCVILEDTFPCIRTVVIVFLVSIYSCGDSVGFAPNFPFKLHLVVPR
jgi:hypothetical protein